MSTTTYRIRVAADGSAIDLPDGWTSEFDGQEYIVTHGLDDATAVPSVSPINPTVPGIGPQPSVVANITHVGANSFSWITYRNGQGVADGNSGPLATVGTVVLGSP